MLQTERLDLALLDFNLPDMSAKELSERMRADPATSGVPVIYTSASDRPSQLDPDDVFFQEPLNDSRAHRCDKKVGPGREMSFSFAPKMRLCFIYRSFSAWK